MRHLSSLVILLSALCSLMPGCSGERFPTEPSAGNQSDSTYIGSWNWITSIGGYAGRTETPQSEGYTLRIELTPDSIYNVYRSEMLTLSWHFSIRRQKVSGSSDSVDVMEFAGMSVYPPMRIRLIGHDTLNLLDQYMDGYNSYYARVR